MSILTLPKAVGAFFLSVFLAFCAGQVGTPTAAPQSTTTTVVLTTAAPPTTPTTTTTLPDLSGIDFVGLARAEHGRCGEFYDLAMSIGWPADQWPTLGFVMYRESRCNTTSHNKTDPSSGSRGLMQINGFWCRPNQWTDHGWLQDQGILTTCDDLYDPAINLKAGLAIWNYGQEKHGCGWRGPWATKCGKYTEVQPQP